MGRSELLGGFLFCFSIFSFTFSALLPQDSFLYISQGFEEAGYGNILSCSYHEGKAKRLKATPMTVSSLSGSWAISSEKAFCF